MTRVTPQPQSRPWTAAELRKLSAPDRDAILTAAADAAAHDYEGDAALTDFEAFGEKDLHADSSDAGPR